MTTTPNMSLVLPTVSVTAGPTWATNLNTLLELVDAHDHSSSKGVRVTPAGININATVEFNSNDATELNSVSLDTRASAPSTSRAIYTKSGDLYYKNNSGVEVQVTNGSTIAGTQGSITNLGDGGSSAVFSDLNEDFTFYFNSTKLAAFNIGDIRLFPFDGSAAYTNAITLKSPTSLASSYSLTLPSATPTVNQFLLSNGSGVFSWTGSGLVPVGAVVATFPVLTGAYSTVATTAADAYGYVLCGGQTISDATSPMNGQVVPNINNSVFLMGSTTSGSTGGSNSSAHTHTFEHVHQWAHYDSGDQDLPVMTSINSSVTAITDSGFNALQVQAGVTTGATPFWQVGGAIGGSDVEFYTTGVLSAPSGSGATATTSAASATENRPAFISSVYLMRIK